MPTTLSRDELAEAYLQQLPYPPYPVQEEALLAWFTAEQGVLVCAPTGTGKTLIAEAALFEALHNGTLAYYTTPLIALTEQKFAEMQAAAVRWGFSPDDVGLVTGNRRVNPKARVLVVVAEILLNRLLHQAAFDFTPVSAVVMDEFHSFADVERGAVWELSLGMLPPHVKLLLLSATVGNALEFVNWLDRCHGRKVELVQGTERRVPLTYQWVPDELLNEFATRIAAGDDAARQTPALVFCFNRDECWSVAEQLKGCHLLGEPVRSQLLDEVNKLDLSQGAGTKLKQLLMRGVGVHHAGLLPKYRRIVEHLFQRKLLAVCVCTETLAAGINLPARSVVLTSLVKGKPGEQKLLEASTAHQIFGRAGRPQFDDRGYVFALAHEDDVKILRWKQKYDAIPEDTKDPGLMKAKKALKKKRPTRRENQTYWNEQQFDKLRLAPPGKLYSKGQLPWRLLAYLLSISPDVDLIRKLIRKRLMDEPRIRAGEQALDRMLLTLWSGGYVRLDPEPPEKNEEPGQPKVEAAPAKGLFGLPQPSPHASLGGSGNEPPPPPRYSPRLAYATHALPRLLSFRSVNPLYGAFLIEQLGIADRTERLQALESVLGLPGPVLKYVRVPRDLPPGPLATTRLDDELIARGLMAAPVQEGEEEEDRFDRDEPFERPPVFAEKLRLLFDALHPEVRDVETQAVWAAGELFFFGGNFNNFVKSRDLIKQEGLIFRHLLRLILLCEEFAAVCPPEAEPAEWQAELRELSERLAASCRQVDPSSTEEAIQHAHAADLVEGESHAAEAAAGTGMQDH
ncbi:MAG: helicase [Planctomycetia bacterium 21-64-5]|nr:MAG: helicase [Planctomycetia bacterium 21-64-5]HQU42399.1 DEAD/DEAH box helicase [Pirellulales bacterium]